MRVKLSNVSDKESSNLTQKDLEKMAGNYPVYGASGFIKCIDTFHQDKEYIAVVKDGAGIGRTMYLPAKSSIIGTLQYILPKENIESRFLYYAVKSMHLEKYFTGATIPHIYYKDYQNEEFELPSKDRQLEIVKILDKVNSIIEYKKQQLKLLDTLIKSRFVEMFGDPVIDNLQWGQKPLGEFLKSIRYGTSTPPNFSEEGYAFIRATNIKNGYIISKDMKYIDQNEADKIKKCRLQGGELLIVRSGVNSGDTCVVTDEYIGQYAGYDMILEFKEKVNPIFINEMINTEYMDKVVKPLTRRAAQPHLNSEQVRGLPLIQVPKIRQDEFATFVEQVDKL